MNVVGPAAERFQVKVIHLSSASFANTFTGVSCLSNAYFPSKYGIRLIQWYYYDNGCLVNPIYNVSASCGMTLFRNEYVVATVLFVLWVDTCLNTGDS